ncbi:MAG TPA: hypothetical protein VFL72_06990 [Acidimicrobiia bacterium]|nr:hypothetical protein [Acidimicrobiia bacterium]
MLVVLVVALSACDETVVVLGPERSPDGVFISPTTSAPTAGESAPGPITEGFDWAAVTISDLNGLRNGPVTLETLNTLTTTCLDSVIAFTTMGQVLVGDVERVLDIGVAAENGTASIADAADAFDVWGNSALMVGYMAIHVVDNASFPPEALRFIDGLGEAARHAGGPAAAIGVQGFLAASGEIKSTELELWRRELSEGLDKLTAFTDSVDSEALCR